MRATIRLSAGIVTVATVEVTKRVEKDTEVAGMILVVKRVVVDVVVGVTARL